MEIMVVVAIIGLITAVTMITFVGNTRDTELDEEAQRLEALFSYVREQAELQTRDYGFRINDRSYSFVVFDVLGDQWRPVDEDDALREREFPRRPRTARRGRGPRRGARQSQEGDRGLLTARPHFLQWRHLLLRSDAAARGQRRRQGRGAPVYRRPDQHTAAATRAKANRPDHRYAPRRHDEPHARLRATRVAASLSSKC